MYLFSFGNENLYFFSHISKNVNIAETALYLRLFWQKLSAMLPPVIVRCAIEFFIANFRHQIDTSCAYAVSILINIAKYERKN